MEQNSHAIDGQKETEEGVAYPLKSKKKIFYTEEAALCYH